MNDIHPDIKRYLAEQFQTLSPYERLLRGFGLMEMGWKMAEIAVKRRNPRLTGRELQLAVFRWVYRGALPESTLDVITLEARLNQALI